MKEPLKPKQLSNPISSGGAGVDFENDVQSSFVVLLLTQGIYPALGNDFVVSKIEFQTKRIGYNLDDVLVHFIELNNSISHKMLTQIKLNISFTDSDENFNETIKAAWDDFNNPQLFNKNSDFLTLITSFISKNDNAAITFILEQAKAAYNAKDFQNRIYKSNYSSRNIRKKFDVFRKALKKSNSNIDLTEEQVWEFLKHFKILIYDMHIKGVCHALLYTILKIQSSLDAHLIWCETKECVQNINKQAGYIDLNNAPERLLLYFNHGNSRILLNENKNIKTLGAVKKYGRVLALLFLIGSFNENNSNDIDIVKKFIGSNYNNWLSNLREIIQEEYSPIFIDNGVWKIKDRLFLFNQVKTQIYDEDITNFVNAAKTIFKEIDPKFELDKEKRFCANIYGKICKYSGSLKNGVSESMAIIGTHEKEIKNCSKNKVNISIFNILENIFENSSWQLWASLYDYLTYFAEANPKKFIDIVDKENSTVFLNLFKQECDVLYGGYYILGILRALEVVAWDKKLLSEATLLLGELANIDPGGNHGNRPINSLKEIFIPWHVQTLASIEEQKIAMRNLYNEYPDITWEVLMTILPNGHQYSIGTSKPKYRYAIDKNWEYKITNKEYYEICSYYIEFLIERARNNIDKLCKIVDILPEISDSLFNKIIEYMSEKTIIGSSDKYKYKLWNDLKTLTNRHIKYSYTDWAMRPEKISKLKEVINLLEPKDIVYSTIRDFSNSIFLDYDLDFKTSEDKDFMEKIAKIQYEKVENIIKCNNYNEIIYSLLDKIENHYEFGFVLGKIYEINFDNEFLPKLLLSKKKNEQNFISGYIAAKFHYIKLKYVKENWNWIDKIDKSTWTEEEVSLFYQYIPLVESAIDKISKLKKSIQNNYWQNVKINPFGIQDFIDKIIDKMIQYKRKNSAIDCLYAKCHLCKHNTLSDLNKIIQVLTMQEAGTKLQNNLDLYHAVVLIEILQNNGIDRSQLATIEWIYMDVLDEYNGHKITALIHELANKPEFFCKIIQTAYKSSKQDKINEIKTKYEQKIASHAWNLLNRWNIPPGTNENGEFSYNDFENWYIEVQKNLDKSGHLDVGLYHLGQVLYHTPVDADGFWINRKIAKLLNKKNNNRLRQAYYTRTLNSRGVHFVDPEAKPEKELVEKFNRLADETEKEGFARFAATLRELADFYSSEAERILEENLFKR